MVTDELYALASRPDTMVNTYSGCIINGARFLIEKEDENRITQNSGVYRINFDEGEDVVIYGALHGVLEFNYLFGYQIILFNCKWFKTDPKTRKIDHSLWTDITFDEDYPYVLTNVVQQAIYIKPLRSEKYMQKFQHWHFWDALEVIANVENITGDTSVIELPMD